MHELVKSTPDEDPSTQVGGSSLNYVFSSIPIIPGCGASDLHLKFITEIRFRNKLKVSFNNSIKHYVNIT